MKINAFTILEILTATVIFSIIVSFIYFGYFNIQGATRSAVDQQKTKIELQELLFAMEKDVFLSDKIAIDSNSMKIEFYFKDSLIRYSFPEELNQVVKLNVNDTVQVFNVKASLENWSSKMINCNEQVVPLLNHFKVNFTPFEGQSISKDFYKNITVKMKYNICVANGF